MMRSLRVLAMAGVMTVCAMGYAEAAFHVGDTGSPVREVQRRLISAGYRVTVDGAYGPATAQAVRDFQRRHNLDADGVVGPLTYKALTGKTMPKGKVSKTHIKGMDEEASFESYSWDKKSEGERHINWHTGAITNGTAKAVTEEAKKYIGIPYRFGGTDTQGFDCSGFIQYVFRKKGVSLPRAADEQYGLGKKVSRNALQPGDLVFFSTYEKGVSHSGIYVGDGNFISATSSKGIAVADMTSGYWYERYIGAKRIL